MILNDKNQERDVYVAFADLTRRKLLHILADADELPLHDISFNKAHTNLVFYLE